MNSIFLIKLQESFKKLKNDLKIHQLQLIL